jgi:acyl-coenzyme A thioesterase PaaI-like protein
MAQSFAEVTSIVAVEPGRYRARLDPSWTIAGKPNGGYLLAVLGRAAVTLGGHPHVLAISGHFLAAPVPEPAEIDAEVLRAGRGASQLRVRLRQEDRTCVEALVTTATLDAAEPHWTGGLAVPAVPAPESCMRVPGVTPLGMPVPIMEQVTLCLDPAVTGFAVGEPSGNGVMRGWLALAGDETFDPLSLVYATDALPPATFEVEVTGWVPTIELTAYVRALPEPGPVLVEQRAHVITAQRVDQTAYVWDRSGRLVAQGTQLAGIRLG